MAFDGQPTLRIYTKGVGGTGLELSLSIRKGTVVLSKTDYSDKNQQWIKVTSYATKMKDAEGHPGFVLVNKGTGQALSYAGSNQPVGLVNYKPGSISSVLWTESDDCGDGFRFIRRLDRLNLVFNGEFGYVTDGSRLIIWNKGTSDNELWKMDLIPHQLMPSTLSRIFSFSALFSSLGIQNGVPVLVPSDSYDVYQNWVEDTRYGYRLDKDGNPGFALYSAATGEYLHHVKDGDKYKVVLISADPYKLTDAAIWTRGSKDFGQGYKNIRMINNTDFNFTFRRDTSQSTNVFPLLLGTDKSSKESMWKLTPQETVTKAQGKKSKGKFLTSFSCCFSFFKFELFHPVGVAED